MALIDYVSSRSEAARWRADAFAVVEHDLAAEHGRHDDAAEPRAIIRRHRMAMIEARRVDDHLAIGIEDHEVGVVAGRDRALAPVEAGEAGRRGGHPLGERDATECAGRAAPVHTTGSAICSDAMPPQAARKSPSSTCFSAAGAGEWSVATRSIAPVGERAPQPLAMLALADRRRAFQRRVAVGDVFGAERQVVRAGFDGQRQTPAARAPPIDGERVRRGEVHDVHARRRLRATARSADRSRPVRRSVGRLSSQVA